MSSLSRPGDLYISPQGSDGWSGRLPEPDATGEDGPLASIAKARDVIRQRKTKGELPGPITVLTEPGEWYLDRTLGRVYYLPLADEQIEEIDAVAPRTEYLLRLEGSPDEGRYVEFLRFEGLCFRHSSWVQPKGIANRWPSEADMDPSIEYAADAQAALSVPGAIRLCGARCCAIEDCVIEHIGWYGIELSDGCLGNRIVGNEIHDLGAGGIKIDGAGAQGSVARRTGNNKVTDNHIHDGSRVFHSGYGILMTHSFGNDISHNHVHDFYVTGISSGWVWDYSESVSHDNHIEKNHIHDIGKGLLSDLAGIYTLSVQPGTVIRGNVIHDIEKWNYGGWAIYPDQASSHILIESNVCYRVDSEPFYQHFGRENVVRNNIFAFGAEGQAAIGKPEAHPAFTFERNILITDGTALFVGIPENLKRANFYSDLNLFWDVSGRDLLCADANVDTDGRFYWVETFSLETWREMGHDLHSFVADPRCKDLDNLDFTLAPDSPAFSLGFRPIDTSDVGPRPKGHRE